jgi:hypothetical protein
MIACERPQDAYGYTPGDDPNGEFPKNTNNDKHFARGDFNVAKGHQSSATTTSTRSMTSARRRRRFRAPTILSLRQQDHLTVGQLNSQFGKGVNEFR